MNILFQDLRYGARMLLKHKAFTLVAVLSLALGIGANTAIFSVVDAVLLKSLPVVEPDRLVVFGWYAGRSYRVGGMSGTSNLPDQPGMRGLSLFRYEVFDQMRQTRAARPDSPLGDLFAFAPMPDLSAGIGDQAELINGQVVTGGYFNGLRLQPSLGRLLTEEDDKPGAAPVVVLSHQFWQQRFDGDRSVMGRTLKLNKQTFRGRNDHGNSEIGPALRDPHLGEEAAAGSTEVRVTRQMLKCEGKNAKTY